MLNLKKLLEKILKSLNFKLKNVTSANQTTAAGATTTLTITPPSGAIAVVGYYMAGGSAMNVYMCRLANGTIQFYARNNGSSVQNWNVTVQCLCFGVVS